MTKWITCYQFCDELEPELFFKCSNCSCRSDRNSPYCPDCGSEMENGIRIVVERGCVSNVV